MCCFAREKADSYYIAVRPPGGLEVRAFAGPRTLVLMFESSWVPAVPSRILRYLHSRGIERLFGGFGSDFVRQPA